LKKKQTTTTNSSTQHTTTPTKSTMSMTDTTSLLHDDDVSMEIDTTKGDTNPVNCYNTSVKNTNVYAFSTTTVTSSSSSSSSRRMDGHQRRYTRCYGSDMHHPFSYPSTNNPKTWFTVQDKDVDVKSQQKANSEHTSSTSYTFLIWSEPLQTVYTWEEFVSKLQFWIRPGGYVVVHERIENMYDEEKFSPSALCKRLPFNFVLVDHQKDVSYVGCSSPSQSSPKSVRGLWVRFTLQRLCCCKDLPWHFASYIHWHADVDSMVSYAFHRRYRIGKSRISHVTTNTTAPSPENDIRIMNTVTNDSNSGGNSEFTQSSSHGRQFRMAPIVDSDVTFPGIGKTCSNEGMSHKIWDEWVEAFFVVLSRFTQYSRYPEQINTCLRAYYERVTKQRNHNSFSPSVPPNWSPFSCSVLQSHDDEDEEEEEEGYNKRYENQSSSRRLFSSCCGGKCITAYIEALQKLMEMKGVDYYTGTHTHNSESYTEKFQQNTSVYPHLKQHDSRCQEDYSCTTESDTETKTNRKNTIFPHCGKTSFEGSWVSSMLKQPPAERDGKREPHFPLSSRMLCESSSKYVSKQQRRERSDSSGSKDKRSLKHSPPSLLRSVVARPYDNSLALSSNSSSVVSTFTRHFPRFPLDVWDVLQLEHVRVLDFEDIPCDKVILEKVDHPGSCRSILCPRDTLWNHVETFQAYGEEYVKLRSIGFPGVVIRKKMWDCMLDMRSSPSSFSSSSHPNNETKFQDSKKVERNISLIRLACCYCLLTEETTDSQQTHESPPNNHGTNEFQTRLCSSSSGTPHKTGSDAFACSNSIDVIYPYISPYFSGSFSHSCSPYDNSSEKKLNSTAPKGNRETLQTQQDTFSLPPPIVWWGHHQLGTWTSCSSLRSHNGSDKRAAPYQHCFLPYTSRISSPLGNDTKQKNNSSQQFAKDKCPSHVWLYRILCFA
jgi:hypothetical protein